MLFIKYVAKHFSTFSKISKIKFIKLHGKKNSWILWNINKATSFTTPRKKNTWKQVQEKFPMFTSFFFLWKIFSYVKVYGKKEKKSQLENIFFYLNYYENKYFLFILKLLILQYNRISTISRDKCIHRCF